MRKNIFSRYFSICASLILVSMLLLGALLMLFYSQYFKMEKYQLLESNVEKAVSVIEEDVVVAGRFEEDDLKINSFLNIMSDAISADIFVVNTAGRTVFCTQSNDCIHNAYLLPAEIRGSLNREDFYREMGSLGGIYDTHYYTVGSALKTSSGEVCGYVMASTEASQQLSFFLIGNLKMFLICGLIVLVIATIIVYFVTRQMVKPLKEMSVVAQRFGKGDFSQQLPVYDYDEVGQLAMAMNNMAQSVSVLENMRRSFIANVSHELKTPMTTISGFIDGILDGTIPPNQQKRYLRIVSDEVKRLSRLVRSMLNLSRIEAGEMELNYTSFDIIGVICEILFSLENQIEAKGLEVRGLDHDKLFVEADEELIHQVVYNLVENAIKFSNENGYLEFEFLKENGRLLIGVKNSGEGLSKEEVSHVFDRFYKTDRSRGIDKNGVGLGLYIVRSILNLHKEEIIVKSVQGEYCEFLFTLRPGKGNGKLKK